MILLVSLFSYFNGFQYGLSAYMKPYKTTDISRSHQRFLREMSCEERAKKFHASWWRVATLGMEFLRSSFSPQFARKPSVASQNDGFFLRLKSKNMDNTCTSVVWNRRLCPIIPKCRLLAVFTLETDNRHHNPSMHFKRKSGHWGNVN